MFHRSVPNHDCDLAVHGNVARPEVTLIRFIVLVVLVLVGVMAYRVVMVPSRPLTPTEAAFKAADDTIDRHVDAVGFGDDVALATAFAKLMKAEQAQRFSGGAQNRAATMTHENFLTYCRIVPDGICLLVHVPQLKNYKDEVRVALAEMAWELARPLTASRLAEGRGQLTIGLRGAMMYGAIASGRHGDAKPQIEEAASVPREKLHRWFAPTEPAAAVTTATTR